METFDSDLLLLFFFLSILFVCAAAVCYGIASWWKYRFSAWWLLVLACLPLALFMFPLYSHLRYKTAMKKERPQPEIERNRLYRRMSWALVVCYFAASIITRFFLHGVMPSNGYVDDMQLALTTISLAIASVGCLWAVGRK